MPSLLARQSPPQRREWSGASLLIAAALLQACGSETAPTQLTEPEPDPPALLAVTPTQGVPGQVIRIVGLDPVPAGFEVRFSGAEAGSLEVRSQERDLKPRQRRGGG